MRVRLIANAHSDNHSAAKRENRLGYELATRLQDTPDCDTPVSGAWGFPVQEHLQWPPEHCRSKRWGTAGTLQAQIRVGLMHGLPNWNMCGARN